MKHFLNLPNSEESGLIRNSAFKMHAIQYIEKDMQLNIPNEFNKYFTIIWITKSKRDNRFDTMPVTQQDNCFLFIKPGHLHKVCLGNVVEGYIFSFCRSFLGIEDHDSESLLRCLAQLFSKKSIALKNDDLTEFYHITELLLKEHNSFSLFRTEILRRYFKILLIYLSRQLNESQSILKPSRNLDLFQNFTYLIEQNFRNQKMVADYADLLAVTPNYLNEVIKKVTGYPAGYHIRQRVVLEAKRKAIYSDVSMKELAYDLGFFDLAHFSKFFKNAIGMSFSDFKKCGRNISTTWETTISIQ